MKITINVLMLFIALCSTHLYADRFNDVDITSVKLNEHIYMLSGAGGNMALLVGKEELALVDSQYAELANKIQLKINELAANQTLSILINTHMHGDHVGGNSALATKATIVAHKNVLKRLDQNNNFPRTGLPTLIFENTHNLNVDNHTVRLEYFADGHTDGDIVVWFENDNIVHFGDLLFEGRFPFIDTNNGGSVKGYIENTRKLISMLDENTKVIPGHGNLTDKTGVLRSLVMMEETLAIVQGYKKDKLTLEQAIAKGLGEKWASWHWSFITETRWITTLYNAD